MISIKHVVAFYYRIKFAFHIFKHKKTFDGFKILLMPYENG